jgi:hypothetical protein
MTHSSALLRTCVFLVGTAGSIGCNRSDQARSENTGKPAKPAVAAVGRNEAETPLTPLDPSTRGYELGKFYGYRLKLATTIALANGPKAYDFDLTGKVGLIPVKVTPESVTLHISIPDAAAVSRIPESQSEFDKVTKEMRETGAYFTLTAGRLAELFVPPGQGPMVSTTYRQVASAIQFARPKDESKSYTTHEYDTSGRYVAKYERSPDGRGWLKRKEKYGEFLGAKSAPSDRPIPMVPGVVSRNEMRLLASGRPESVTLNESVTLEGTQMPLSSTLAIELVALGESAAPPNHSDLVALLDRAHRVAADEPIGIAPSAEALDAARIGELDFEEILARLEQVANETAPQPDLDAEPKTDEATPTEAERAEQETQVKEDSRLFLALSALLRQKPETVGKVTKAIRAKSAASFALCDALASSSTPEAQKALVGLIDEKGLDPKLRGRVINALTRTPIPTDGSIAALKALIKEDAFNRRAIYGLGSFSRRLRDGGKTKQAKEIGEFLLARLALAKVPMHQVTVLRGIANSGHTAALPKLTPYVSSDQAKVRVAAVRALQAMSDPQVDGILATRMKSDASNDVRVSAIVAAQQREPSAELTNGLASAATDASDATVRFRAVELITRWLPKRPELRSTLERVARQDQEARVRDRAKAAL